MCSVLVLLFVPMPRLWFVNLIRWCFEVACGDYVNPTVTSSDVRGTNDSMASPSARVHALTIANLTLVEISLLGKISKPTCEPRRAVWQLVVGTGVRVLR